MESSYSFNDIYIYINNNDRWSKPSCEDEHLADVQDPMRRKGEH